MSRRGFALLAVLWLLAALSGLLAASMGALRTGDRATRNRLLLLRARWAADACAEIARARWTAGTKPVNGIELLGRDTRCGWVMDDPLAHADASLDEASRVSAAAPANVLGSVPGLTTEAIALMAHRSALGRPITSLDELSGLVSAVARAAIQEHYRELSGRLIFVPSTLRLTAIGTVGRDPEVSQTIELLVGIESGRASIVRRRIL